MAELADALDLGSSSFGSAGSTPVIPTGHWPERRITQGSNHSKRRCGAQSVGAWAVAASGISCELVAQLVEQRTFNPWVARSSRAELIYEDPGGVPVTRLGFLHAVFPKWAGLQSIDISTRRLLEVLLIHLTHSCQVVTAGYLLAGGDQYLVHGAATGGGD